MAEEGPRMIHPVAQAARETGRTSVRGGPGA